MILIKAKMQLTLSQVWFLSPIFGQAQAIRPTLYIFIATIEIIFFEI